MILALLVAARFAHFAASLSLFGGWLYALHGLRGAALAPAAARVIVPLRPMLLTAAVIALASGALWIAMTVANIGGTFASAADAGTWAMVLGETDFGRVWIVRLALAAALVGATLFAVRKRSPALDLAAAVLGTVLLASLALLGHTQVEEGGARAVHMGADALHLLGAGAWLGGLAALALLLRPAADPPLGLVHQALGRFSAMGVAAVAALAVSGLVNAWFLVGTPQALVATTYGRVLLLKLSLFGLMVALAAENRFRVTGEVAAAAQAGAPPAQALKAIRRNVALEQVLGAAILALVAVLGAIEPASAGR